MSLATTLWIVRHGETDWNHESRIQGTTDIPLNHVGMMQARLVAQRLSAISFDAIYSSSLGRAYQTAIPLSEIAGLNVVRAESLAERNFGEFQGKTPDEISALDPSGYRRWQARELEFAPTGGESLLAFRDRIASGFEDIVKSWQGKTIAIFTHGGVLDMVYRLAQNLELQSLRTWPIPNAGVQCLHWAHDSATISLWGDVAHLVGAPSRDELRGIA